MSLDDKNIFFMDLSCKKIKKESSPLKRKKRNYNFLYYSLSYISRSIMRKHTCDSRHLITETCLREFINSKIV